MDSKQKYQEPTSEIIIKFVPNIISEIPIPVLRAILKTLLEVVGDEQSTFTEKIDRMIAEPYKSGHDYLYDANEADSDKRREELIKGALDKFRTASNVEISLMSAKSQFFVAVCYDLLLEPQLALKWYEKAYHNALIMYLKKPDSIKGQAIYYIQSTLKPTFRRRVDGKKDFQ